MKKIISILILLFICVNVIGNGNIERNTEIKILVIVTNNNNIEIKCDDFTLLRSESWGNFSYKVICWIGNKIVYKSFSNNSIYAYWKEEE